MNVVTSNSLVLVLCRDLLFASKITSTAQAIGVSVMLIRDPAKLDEQSSGRMIVDLNQAGFLEAAAAWKLRTGGYVTGFTGHADLETMEKARAAGFDAVLARGALAGSLEAVLKGA